MTCLLRKRTVRTHGSSKDLHVQGEWRSRNPGQYLFFTNIWCVSITKSKMVGLDVLDRYLWWHHIHCLHTPLYLFGWYPTKVFKHPKSAPLPWRINQREWFKTSQNHKTNPLFLCMVNGSSNHCYFSGNHAFWPDRRRICLRRQLSGLSPRRLGRSRFWMVRRTRKLGSCQIWVTSWYCRIILEPFFNMALANQPPPMPVQIWSHRSVGFKLLLAITNEAIKMGGFTWYDLRWTEVLSVHVGFPLLPLAILETSRNGSSTMFPFFPGKRML